MSSIGQPCARRLWYQTNLKATTSHSASTSFKFLYGDVIEDLVLALAKAAGHSVEGQQDELVIEGIKGHRDAVIDGVTVDVKSASSYSFEKFKKGLSESDDSFGYLTQLPSYVKAAENDPLVTDKEGGAFLVVDKVDGRICLDYHNFKEEGSLDEVEKFFKHRIDMSSKTTPPSRGFNPQPEGKSGNMALGFNCSFCEFKEVCHPGLRKFNYKPRPKYLTKVVREPKVEEIK